MAAVPPDLATALQDRYRLERELGQGGMATVYLARDLKHDRLVALKVLDPQVAVTIGPERFQLEIKLAARLQHPHIVSVHDSGEAAGQLWFTMPYVEGESLRDRLRREKQLPVENALQIVREAALALEYAHQQGVVHRDIKPENLLLTRDGSTLVADFGIGKSLSGQPGQHLTESGMALGTPAYMSPEQALGSETVDSRTDVYALGCVLYEMLAGEAPYSGPSVQAILAKQLSLPIPSVRIVRPETPEALDRALARALGRTPADRFGSMRQFAEALLDPSSEAPPEQSIAVLPFANLSADAANEYFSDGMTEEIINALSRVPSLRVASRTSSFAFKGKQIPIGRIGADLQVRTVLEGSVRWAEHRLRITVQLINAADGYQLWSERYDREMVDVFEVQDQIARAIVDTLRVRLQGGRDTPIIRQGTEDLEAYHLYLKGRHFQHAVALPKAVSCFEAAIARDPQFAQAYAGLADVYSLLGLYGHLPSSVALPKARAAADHAIELNESLAEAHEARGRAELYFGWDFAVMERELRRAIRLNPRQPSAYGWLGLGLALLGRFDEVEAQVVRAYEFEPLANAAVLGFSLLCVGQTDRAHATLQRTLDLYPASVQALWVIGLGHSLQGEHEESLATLGKAVALTGRSALMLGEMGASLAQAGRRAEALAILEELRRKAAQGYVPPMSFARVYMYLGEMDALFTWLDKALAERDVQVVWSAVWPGLDHVRADPRYPALLQKHGLKSLLSGPEAQ